MNYLVQRVVIWQGSCETMEDEQTMAMHVAEIDKQIDAFVANKDIAYDFDDMTNTDLFIYKMEMICGVLKYMIDNPSTLISLRKELMYNKCKGYRESIKQNYNFIPTKKRQEFLKVINNLELLNGQNTNC